MNRPRRSVRPSRHIRARFRPTLDRLEGRALMAIAGSLDPTFGTKGLDFAQFHPGNDAGLSTVFSVATEPDGSIVELGTAGMSNLYQGTGKSTTFGLIHLAANGALDSSFGAGGEVDLTLPTGQALLTGGPLLIQPDGRIIVHGTTDISPNTSGDSEYSIVARFNTDGTPDTTFGTGGLVEFGPTGSTNSTVFTDAALQANGQILLAGRGPIPGSTTGAVGLAVRRLNSNGQVDATFGTAGTEILAGANTANGVVVEPGGQIIVFGQQITLTDFGESYVAEIFRLAADGTPDPSFTSAGLQSTMNNPLAVAVQPNAQIVVAGVVESNNVGQLSIPAIVARLNADGSPDKSISLPINDNYQFPYQLSFGAGSTAVGLQPNGDILISSSGSVVGPVVTRLTPNLTLDDTFGTAGAALIPIPLPAQTSSQYSDLFLGANSLAITPSGQVIVAGTGAVQQIQSEIVVATYNVVARLNLTSTKATAGDFSGDGVSDPAVFLAGPSTFVIGNSSGGAGRVVQLGAPGLGNTIPAPGDYAGIGRDAPAVYMAQFGYWAMQDPTGQTPGLTFPFGQAGVGNTVPVQADYFGTGQDDVAVYLTQSATWDILKPGLGPGLVIPFGVPGVGYTAPVPGDYFGVGSAQVAVYLPGTATWSIVEPGSSSVLDVHFGIPGAGNAIPVPGDYDGSGRTELAVYLPALSEFQYISGQNQVVTVPLTGLDAAAQALPAPGDYAASGVTNFGAYLPATNQFAYVVPSTGLVGLPPYAQETFTVGFTDQGPIVPAVAPAVPAVLLSVGSGSGNAIEPAGATGQADALDFLMPPASDAKKAKPGDTSAN